LLRYADNFLVQQGATVMIRNLLILLLISPCFFLVVNASADSGATCKKSAAGLKETPADI
jgi:hypothetical protein